MVPCKIILEGTRDCSIYISHRIMGAGSSVQTMSFDNQIYYDDWPLQSVKAVYEQALKKDMKLRKADWFNTFVDYSIQAENESETDFLKLPLEEFNRVSKDGKIADVTETFVMLALLCQGDFDDRMKFLVIFLYHQ